uniref:AP endonuclease, family 2 (Nfo) n=1 Tax=uncultured marine group II/III euryarchaeote KM3_203_B10 TaxID=1457981 RepID=A0A075H0N6_9EURY|nr:AP endonuclease, family 2 (nfo) [uncultured marine group II/III euryarchaeote KM3_203_B10]
MPLKLGPAGVPLSCKGRTIVEGMDDITALGLDTMEIQTVRTVQPQHFDQYWQAGILSWKTEFEMNLHGPYYAEILGNRRERNRTLSKMEAAIQAAKVINARHITFHVGPYGSTPRGPEANEQVANVFSGVVDRVRELWGDETKDEEHIAFPWLIEDNPALVGIETSGRQELWGTLDEVLEVCNHVDGTVPVLNLGHIHARGHGRLRTSEDFGELFDEVRERLGGKKFFCHFAGVEHRMGNALHYTQIKKSDLKFEPLAEFLAEEGDWLDVTIISDSPLLEHDAMFMLQQYDRAKHRLLEKKARDERNIDLALKAGLDPEELAARTKAEKEKRIASEQEAKKSAKEAAEKKTKKASKTKKADEPKKKSKPKKSAAKGAANEDLMDIGSSDDDDDDIF